MKRMTLAALVLAAVLAARSAAFGAAAHEAPFTLKHNNIFLDNVTLSGQGAYRAMIDTGSTHNLVDVDLAKSLGLQPTGKLPVAATGGALEMPAFAADLIALDSAPLMQPDMPLLGGPLRRESAPIEQDMDLILGYPLFRRWVVELDFEKSVMRLHEPAQYTPPAGAQSLPINLAMNVPLAKCRLDGAPGNFMIDTGANSMVDIYPEFLAASELHKKHAVYRMPVYGLGGSVDSILLRADTLEFASSTLKGFRVYAHAANPLNSMIDGLVGTEILRRFTVVLDYNRRMVYLTPNAHYEDPWQEERAGLTALRLDGDYVVVSVAQGSPAHSAGLEMGDKILTVDGRPASETGISGMRTLVRQPPGAVLSLTVDRGGEQKTIAITLADYIKQ